MVKLSIWPSAALSPSFYRHLWKALEVVEGTLGERPKDPQHQTAGSSHSNSPGASQARIKTSDPEACMLTEFNIVSLSQGGNNLLCRL